MKRNNCTITALAAIVLSLSMSLTACSSDEDVWNEIFDDPADFTAATRVEQSSPEIVIGTEESAETPASSLDESSEEEQEQEEEEEDKLPDMPLNEYGLYDQYFINSNTYAFNAMLAEKHFTCDVTYFFPSEPGGKAVKQYSEKNEINGTDRHFLTRLEDGDRNAYYDKEIFYIKDVNGEYTAYILNWNNATYTAYDDEQQLQQIRAFGPNIPSALFYGIDDLETAVYLGYLPDPKKGTVVEKFMIEDSIYTFTYDEDGILTRSEVDGRIAKVKSFENSCPPLKIPSGFTFE